MSHDRGNFVQPCLTWVTVVPGLARQHTRVLPFKRRRPGPAGGARKNPMIRWSSSSVTVARVAERSTGLLEPLIFALLVSL